ncbi:hypothetical protein R1T08_37000 [Streptomyces sp. SBC-4]|nr:hypothetical protein [Streptomyces sp. SBC-4]MDV5149567.1 hypothetical protein [Streptomyces sp. SBC-4]
MAVRTTVRHGGPHGGPHGGALGGPYGIDVGGLVAWARELADRSEAARTEVDAAAEAPLLLGPGA